LSGATLSRMIATNTTGEPHMRSASADATLPPITFNAQNAEAYEQVMGRWSQRLAPLLIRFGGLADGERVLDVGCGTGSLSLTVPRLADVATVTGVDVGTAYLDFATARNSDPRVTFREADARALPFETGSFDRVFSMLVLQFIPDFARAVAELRRVVRPGGTVTAATWDTFSGLPHIRLMWDIATVLDPLQKRANYHPLTQTGGMAAAWQDAGLVDVEQTSLLFRIEFSCFDEYWAPFATGEGPPGQFVARLSQPVRERLRDELRRAFLFEGPDGPRSFACVAWACRGTVPA
jgi:ubiquinone/menaquinone biosynthesis C-methylase UbiE